MLMPGQTSLVENALEFQFNFIKSGGIPVVLGMITKNNFMSKADIPTKR